MRVSRSLAVAVFLLLLHDHATAREFFGVGDSEKYEKIATLTETTRDYDADRKRVDDLISTHQGIIQLERAAGLKGRRILDLAVGLPPGRFDAFIEAAKAVGTNVQAEIIKNNKTDEYLLL